MRLSPAPYKQTGQTPGSATVSGQLSRAANSASGSFALAVRNSLGTVNYSGQWTILSVSGTVSYDRSANQLTFNATEQRSDGSVISLTGSSSYKVDSPSQISIPQFFVTGSDSKTY